MGILYLVDFSSHVLDIPHGNAHKDQKVQLFTKHGRDNQLFELDIDMFRSKKDRNMIIAAKMLNYSLFDIVLQPYGSENFVKPMFI